MTINEDGQTCLIVEKEIRMGRCIFITPILVLTLGFVSFGLAQESEDIKELKLRDWQPRSMMKTKETVVEKPAFPVIDVHNHLGGGKDFLTPERINRYLTEMDAAGVRTVVNLDGDWGDQLSQTVALLDEAYPGRFLTFALLDFDGIDDENWGQREAERLEKSFYFKRKERQNIFC